jgi:hypothetical protein
MPRASTKLAEPVRKYGLDQYAQAFAEHNIVCRVRSDLTENHLQSLGISLGHRNKLFKANDYLTLCPATQLENKHGFER